MKRMSLVMVFNVVLTAPVPVDAAFKLACTGLEGMR
jgi:hypothetical protein